MCVKNIFVILTPFQHKMMELVFGDALKSGDTVLFYTRHVPIEMNLYEGQCVEIRFKPFSFIDLKKSPFRNFKAYKKEIKNIENYVRHFIQTNTFDANLNIVLGTDKDNFTQILLNLIFKEKSFNVVLHAVEEGLGYYVKESGADRFKAFVYKVLTPVLFGQRLLYHRQLGTDPRINKLYVRLPDMLPKHKGLRGKDITELAQEYSEPGNPSGSNKVLIFSFPNKDYDIDADRKKEIYQTLLMKLDGKQIYVKPHPREETDVFDQFTDVHVLDKTSIGEELDYFQYGAIINFSSSVIIDILHREYPAERIFTIAITPIRFSFFEKTHCIKLEDLNSYNFEVAP